eukprot:909184-Heterocapsa_arctica.AAC.1
MDILGEVVSETVNSIFRMALHSLKRGRRDLSPMAPRPTSCASRCRHPAGPTQRHLQAIHFCAASAICYRNLMDVHIHAIHARAVDITFEPGRSQPQSRP